MSAHVRERLGEYFDGEISGEERSAVSQHLRECSECRRFLEELAAVDDAARSLPAEAPEGYFDTFASRVRERLRPGSRRAFRPPVWSLALAAALLLAVITPLTLKEHPAPVPTSFSERAAAPVPRDRPSPADAQPVGQAVPKATEPAGGASAGAFASPPAVHVSEVRSEVALQEAKDVAEPRHKKEGPPPAKAQVAEADEATSTGAAPAPTLFPCEGCPPSPQAAVADRADARTSAVTAASAEEGPSALVKARRAPGVAALSGGPAGSDRLSAAGEARYRMLRTRTPATAAEARELRLEWRAFAELMLGQAHADDARVAAIETAVQAYRYSASADDREMAVEDARAYLARADAPQAERVKALLETLSAAP